jgi:ubiquinone biosynthesis protein
VEQGRLSINVRLLANERDRRVVTGLTNQILLTLVGAVSGIVAAVLLGTSGGAMVTLSVARGQLPPATAATAAPQFAFENLDGDHP